MTLFHSPNEYLFNLYTTNSGEARRIWKQKIREEWNHQCAYCGSKDNLTIDHIVPRSRGGTDFTKNVVCCCNSCNHDKSHHDWEEWFTNQNFYNEISHKKIIEWMKPDPPINLFSYRPRKNNAS